MDPLGRDLHPLWSLDISDPDHCQGKPGLEVLD